MTNESGYWKEYKFKSINEDPLEGLMSLVGNLE